MMTVEVQGKTLILREISDQWGEESHTFLSRPEMMHWAENRFSEEKYADRSEEREAILAAFKEI
ncbi:MULTISPECIES: hypothetical protein [Paenibacillus]|uniref:Uncharacterized protein n=1 Tax=Paenibacillus baimaensis TaxID=2982185 RepID=A0ABT2UJE3_9BACL|nr:MULTISPECIES: hypothetical protein [unclassified Paenibacillus]MCU6794764.1 hypothetical protein [Paenibacillus sp. WQ 127069]OMF19702.1 hypothetical protein BK127_06520 [Paenibacillus sp. FSL H7-0331]